MTDSTDHLLALLYEEVANKPLNVVNTGDDAIYTGLDRSKVVNSSGFCKHNPAIRKFALSSAHNMEVVLAFVFFTMQKGWHDVLQYFPPFMEWYLTKGEKEDFRYSNDEVFHKLTNRFGPLKNKQGDILDSYLKPLHNNINKTYKFVVDHQDDEVAVFIYFNTMMGLAMAKSAFAVQLILGKMGCLDSVNQKVYGSMLPDKLAGKSISRGVTGDITTGGQKNLDIYLKALDHLGKDMHSQLLWDDWCDIVEKKLLYAASKEEYGDIEITLPDGTKSHIKPYASSSKDEREIEMAKSTISGKPGLTVSGQHRDLVTRFGENVFHQLFEEILNETV